MKYPLIDKKKTGRQIGQLMRKQGLSVKDVAEKLDIGSVQCVYQWINGKRMPTIDNLYALADLLDADIDEILCRRRGVGEEDSKKN
ncbi:MAG: helix-turn-helix transcriptional regulator [Lachnospiraceae bacterium]|nr:helix-turn-helix transcriptional regulator [Lachnospiraceae bacterium]